MKNIVLKSVEILPRAELSKGGKKNVAVNSLILDIDGEEYEIFPTRAYSRAKVVAIDPAVEQARQAAEAAKKAAPRVRPAAKVAEKVNVTGNGVVDAAPPAATAPGLDLKALADLIGTVVDQKLKAALG